MDVNDVGFYAVVNINLTLIFRMIQGLSPIRMNLSKIREYETPFGASIKYMKLAFALLVLYMGIPLTSFFATSIPLTVLYVIYWFATVLWWHYFTRCLFDQCFYISTGTSASLLLGLTFFFYSHEWDVFVWLIPLCWSCFTLYVSTWYRNSYANESFISV